MLAAYGILAGEIRLLDNVKSGEIRDQFAIAPKTLGQFMGAVKNGLDSRVKAVAMPVEDVDFYQFNDSNTDMYTDQVSTTTGIGSGLSRVIYSSDRMSSAEIQYAAETQYNLMKPMYAQFANFLNYFGNKLTKRFKFSFVLDGCAYTFHKDKKLERLMKLADKGIILDPTAYAFAVDMKPQDFERSVLNTANNKWYMNLGLFPNTNTASTAQSGGGVERYDDTIIEDSTEYNRNE